MNHQTQSRDTQSASSLTIASIFLSLFFVATGNAFAGGALSAKYERMIAKPAAEVWAIVGSFNGLHEWHPAVVKTDAGGDGATVGDRRLLTLGDGATIDEELTAFNSEEMSLSYKILEGPLPVSDYKSIISVISSDDGNARVIWSSTFSANGASDEEAVDIITGIYVAGLDAIE